MSTPSRPAAYGRAPSVASSLSASQAVQTPTSERSTTIAPKSDLLRLALDARRARDTIVSPSPADRRAVAQQTIPIRGSPLSTDPWIEHARSEEPTPQSNRIRRLRIPSDNIGPHSTHREQIAHQKAVGQKRWDLGLQLDLLKRQNTKLKDDLDAASERIFHLDHENDRLCAANNEFDKELEAERERYRKLEELNQVFVGIQEEAVQKQEETQQAVNEAAELLIGAEQDNAALREEVLKLKALLQANHPPNLLPSGGSVTGDSKERPLPVARSVDGSLASNHHVDSAYNSGPSSPPQVPPRHKQRGGTYAERAEELRTMSLRNQKSVSDLRKRSQAALNSQFKMHGQLVAEGFSVPPSSTHAQNQARPEKPNGQGPVRRQERDGHSETQSDTASAIERSVSYARTAESPGRKDRIKRGLERMRPEDRAVKQTFTQAEQSGFGAHSVGSFRDRAAIYEGQYRHPSFSSTSSNDSIQTYDSFPSPPSPVQLSPLQSPGDAWGKGKEAVRIATARALEQSIGYHPAGRAQGYDAGRDSSFHPAGPGTTFKETAYAHRPKRR